MDAEVLSIREAQKYIAPFIGTILQKKWTTLLLFTLLQGAIDMAQDHNGVNTYVTIRTDVEPLHVDAINVYWYITCREYSEYDAFT